MTRTTNEWHEVVWASVARPMHVVAAAAAVVVVVVVDGGVAAWRQLQRLRRLPRTPTTLVAEDDADCDADCGAGAGVGEAERLASGLMTTTKYVRTMVPPAVAVVEVAVVTTVTTLVVVVVAVAVRMAVATKRADANVDADVAVGAVAVVVVLLGGDDMPEADECGDAAAVDVGCGGAGADRIRHESAVLVLVSGDAVVVDG